jgi:hypothetical protein
LRRLRSPSFHLKRLKTMSFLYALKNLSVTSVTLETSRSEHSVIWPTHPQIQLSAISEPVGGHQVGGRIILVQYDGSELPRSLFRMFRSGLFDAQTALDPQQFDLMWQACTMDFDAFSASLIPPEQFNFGAELQAMDLIFTYEITKGKTGWAALPSEDWIK